jgi:hypothetical protein
VVPVVSVAALVVSDAASAVVSGLLAQAMAVVGVKAAASVTAVSRRAAWRPGLGT